MHKKSRSTFVLGAATMLILMFGTAALTEAQTCAEKLSTATRLAGALERKTNDQQTVIDAQDKKINDQKSLLDLQDQKIDKQREKINAQQEKIDAQQEKIAELQKQIAALEDNVKLSQQNAQMQQTIAQLNAQFIEVQKAAITALVQTSKRSALEKAIDALPSLAGIIAIALTHK